MYNIMHAILYTCGAVYYASAKPMHRTRGGRRLPSVGIYIYMYKWRLAASSSSSSFLELVFLFLNLSSCASLARSAHKGDYLSRSLSPLLLGRRRRQLLGPQILVGDKALFGGTHAQMARIIYGGRSLLRFVLIFTSGRSPKDRSYRISKTFSYKGLVLGIEQS